MAPANCERKPLSRLFQSAYLRDRFAAAERDTPPAAVAVEPDRAPVMTPGAVVRQAVEA